MVCFTLFTTSNFCILRWSATRLKNCTILVLYFSRITDHKNFPSGSLIAFLILYYSCFQDGQDWLLKFFKLPSTSLSFTGEIVAVYACLCNDIVRVAPKVFSGATQFILYWKLLLFSVTKWKGDGQFLLMDALQFLFVPIIYSFFFLICWWNEVLQKYDVLC